MGGRCSIEGKKLFANMIYHVRKIHKVFIIHLDCCFVEPHSYVTEGTNVYLAVCSSLHILSWGKNCWFYLPLRYCYYNIDIHYHNQEFIYTAGLAYKMHQ